MTAVRCHQSETVCSTPKEPRCRCQISVNPDVSITPAVDTRLADQLDWTCFTVIDKLYWIVLLTAPEHRDSVMSCIGLCYSVTALEHRDSVCLVRRAAEIVIMCRERSLSGSHLRTARVFVY